MGDRTGSESEYRCVVALPRLGAAAPSNILEIWGGTNLRVAADDGDGDRVSWVGAKVSERVTTEFVDAGSTV